MAQLPTPRQRIEAAFRLGLAPRLVWKAALLSQDGLYARLYPAQAQHYQDR